MNRSVFDEFVLEGATVYRAPGRVNLIGEHTDYNDGFVMPAAIDLFTKVAIKPRDDRLMTVQSRNFAAGVEIDLDEPAPISTGHWSDYVRGVAVMLERAGYRLKGADLAVQSEVPAGAGLSSSAALEIASGYALLENSSLGVDRVELALLCRQAENEFVGVPCGIMDQFVSCFGRAGYALLLDCRSLEYRLLPIPNNVRIVLCNTMIKRELAGSEYSRRRLECEAASLHFSFAQQGLGALRDVTMADLESAGEDLDEKIYRRCRHVITENARTLKAACALESGDLDKFGLLMSESHNSLRDDYEVSCEELDLMVELAGQVEGVYGARMTGGGFGGCTVNLVAADRVGEFKLAVADGYEKETGIAPAIFACSAADGVGRRRRP